MHSVLKKDFDCAQSTVLSKIIFPLTHLILPLFCLGGAFLWLESSGADVLLSSYFYDATNHLWPYKDHWIIQVILHKGGRLIFLLALAGIMWQVLQSFKSAGVLRQYRRCMVYLLLATVTGPLIIMFLKSQTHIYCPWDLQIFGSFRPYIRWFDVVSADMPIGHCFPAAHAGSGYTFVSLYFFCLKVRPALKWHGLFIGLGLGVVYGVTQQMRGAHFISHDVAALAICWLSSLLLFWVVFRRELQWV